MRSDPFFHFDADSDPTFDFGADPDPTFHFDVDPDPKFHFFADPDPAPHEKMMRIFNYWPTDPLPLRGSLFNLHSSRICDFNSDLDSVFVLPRNWIGLSF